MSGLPGPQGPPAPPPSSQHVQPRPTPFTFEVGTAAAPTSEGVEHYVHVRLHTWVGVLDFGMSVEAAQKMGDFLAEKAAEVSAVQGMPLDGAARPVASPEVPFGTGHPNGSANRAEGPSVGSEGNPGAGG